MENSLRHHINASGWLIVVIVILSCGDRSGYSITFEGAAPEVTVTTDAQGMFHIEDLAAGTYKILFEKPGFQIRKEFSYKFIGGNVPTYYDAPYLSQLSSTSIVSFDISVTQINNPDPSKYTMVELAWIITPEETVDKRRELETYLGLSPDVSSENYTFRLHGPGIIRLDKPQSGIKLYGIAYPKPASCNMWYDFEKHLFSNTCLGDRLK